MIIAETTEDLQKVTNGWKAEGHRIAFVPTMGALHKGHLSLVSAAKSAGRIPIVSIFINPSQFNNKEDFQRYPRMVSQDIELLTKSNCALVFIPSVEEVYPDDFVPFSGLDLDGLDLVMEGIFRPGHFEGMLQVVKRLLDLVQPDELYMGQKDFQQHTLVRHMIQKLNLPVRLIIGPTLRESDGLAMSSRNMRLTPEFRAKAPVIFQALKRLMKINGTKDLPNAIKRAIQMIEDKGLRVEYLEIVDAYNLEKVSDPNSHSYIVACVACWAGDIRLIDNVVLKGPEQ
ncbi:MAG: pantoate--beta-alanine ligase [Saprospiraceae bacterium]|nr:pantoate--beta-alanine ligase [Saprospiraceae bacterium]